MGGTHYRPRAGWSGQGGYSERGMGSGQGGQNQFSKQKYTA